MNIGSRIKYQRELANLTQTELSEGCGWPGQSRVSGYERNTRQPSLRDVELMADFIGCSRAALFLDAEIDNPMMSKLVNLICKMNDKELRFLEKQADLILSER